MGFENLFENKHNHHGNYMENRYPDDKKYSNDSNHSYLGKDYQLKWLNIQEKIRRNKKLKLLVVMASILVLVVIIVLIIILLPIFMKLFNYISQNGLQGIYDSITGFIDKIRKGSGK